MVVLCTSCLLLKLAQVIAGTSMHVHGSTTCKCLACRHAGQSGGVSCHNCEQGNTHSPCWSITCLSCMSCVAVLCSWQYTMALLARTSLQMGRGLLNGSRGLVPAAQHTLNRQKSAKKTPGNPECAQYPATGDTSTGSNSCTAQCSAVCGLCCRVCSITTATMWPQLGEKLHVCCVIRG